MQTVKTSQSDQSSLGAQTILLVLSWGDSNVFSGKTVPTDDVTSCLQHLPDTDTEGFKGA